MTEGAVQVNARAESDRIDPGAVVRPRSSCRVDPLTETADDSSDPLDTRTVPVSGVAGRVSALHVGWVEKRRFVPLVWPPSDHTQLESWLRLVDFIEVDLRWLLTRPYHCFWSQAVYDLQLADTIDTTLQQLPRPHQLSQLPHAHVTRPRVIAVAELLLRVLLRMATYKESRRDRMTPRLFARLVYDNYVWDVERLLDVCSVYGQNNSELLHRLLSTLFTQQPSYWRDFRAFSDALSALFEKLETDAKSAPLEAILTHSLDVVWSLFSLLTCYRLLARSLIAAALPLRLARFYETVVVRLHERLSGSELNFSRQEAEQLEGSSAGMELFCNQLFLTRCCILKTFRLMAEFHWLNSLDAEPSQESADGAESNNLDEYLNLLTDCLSEEVFMKDFNTLYPLSLDLELIGSSCPDVDPERLSYIIDALKESSDTCPSSVPIPQPVSSNNIIVNNVVEESAPTPSEVELQSMVSSVKDLLPDVADAFVVACLKYFSFRIEDVINALLEDSLPEELACLNRDDAETPSDPHVSTTGEIQESDGVCLRLPGGGKARGMECLREEVQQLSAARDSAMRQRYAELGNVYEDEYDDTYDGLPTTIGAADSSESDAPVRQFERIRLNDALPSSKWSQRRYLEQRDEEENGAATVASRKFGHFVEDPAVVRQRRQEQYESKRLARRGRALYSVPKRREGNGAPSLPVDEGSGRESATSAASNLSDRNGKDDSRKNGSNRHNSTRASSPRSQKETATDSTDRTEVEYTRDVVGRAKGQGQTKEVVRNRRMKNIHKGSERRRGSDRKARGGTMC